MSETTTSTGNAEQAPDFWKKLAERMTDISNPDTQSPIRKMFLDFLAQQRNGKTESTDADRDELNREITEAVRGVLVRNRIKTAEVSISLGSIEKQAETNEQCEEPAPTTKPEPKPATDPEPESTEESHTDTSDPELKMDLKRVLDWIDRNMNTEIPCGILSCGECPVGGRIGDHTFCLKCAIIDNAQRIRRSK